MWSVRGRWCAASLAALIAIGAAGGCRQDMADQARNDPLEASDFFPDHRASRPTVAGTVARGQLRDDVHFFTGKVNGQPAATFPGRVKVDRAFLERGQARFNVFCSPCHGPRGDGNGMIVQRGFRQPLSYHIDEIRSKPPGYFFDVITNGYGTMYDYADRIPPYDRWAIVAYVRALQLSQNATIDDVPADQRNNLKVFRAVTNAPAATGETPGPRDTRGDTTGRHDIK